MILDTRLSLVSSCLSVVLFLGWSADVGAQLPAVVTPPPEEPARQYSITLVGSRAILLDHSSGRTWILTDSPISGDPPVWLALQQFDEVPQSAPPENSEIQESLDQQPERLLYLKSQLNLAQKRFPKGHPKILELQKQIEKLEQDAKPQPPPLSKENSASVSPHFLRPLLHEQESLLTHLNERILGSSPARGA